MKIDAKFGIGYKLTLGRSNQSSIERVLKDTKFKLITYSTPTISAIVIKDPFQYGIDLTKIKIELEEMMSKLGLDNYVDSTFDVFGGLDIE